MFHNPTDCRIIITQKQCCAHAHYDRQISLWVQMDGETMADPPLIQVTNVSPQATNQQMKELFSYLGDIKEIKVYPERCV